MGTLEANDEAVRFGRTGLATALMASLSAFATPYQTAQGHAVSLGSPPGIDIVSAVFIGILIALAAYSVLTYFFVRERVRIAHALLCLSLVTAQLLLIGGIAPPGWLDGTSRAELLMPSSIALVGLFASIFTRDFFDTASSAPLYERLLLLTAVLFALSLAAIWIVPPPYGDHAAWLTGLVFTALAIACSIRCIQLRLPGAGLFLVACAAAILGQGLAAIGGGGEGWAYAIGLWGGEAGLLVAAILMSVALARRTDAARSDRAIHLAAELEVSKQSLATARELETSLNRRLEEKNVELDAVKARLRERTRNMQSLAHRDELTQLPNRLLFEDRTTHAITRAMRHKGRLALILIDIEAFRKVNEAHGNAIGDEVLALIAHRLDARLRAGDTVARVDGDEFAVLLEDVFERDDLDRAMTGIIEELALPFELGGKKILIHASMGFAFFPEDGKDTPALLKSADRRMIRVKQSRATTDSGRASV